MSPADPRLPPRRAVDAVAIALTAALALPVVSLAGRALPAGDTFWQLRAGEMILTNRAVPGVDSFTYTVQGAPWNNHEWGFELALALLHRAFGWGGVRAALVALLAGAFAAVALRTSRWASASVGFLAVALLFALGTYKFLPAPQTASMVLFLFAWARFRGPDLLARPARWVPLAVYLCAWANLTAEALTFLPFLLVDQATHAWEAHRRGPLDVKARRARVLALGVVLLAPLLTPPQSSPLEYLIDGTQVNRAVNPEFTPLWAAAATLGAPVKLLARALALACTAALARIALRGDPRSLRRAASGLLFVAGATLIERSLWWLMFPTVALVGERSRADRASLAPDVFALTLGACAMLAALSGLHWHTTNALRALADPQWRSAHLTAEVLPVECDEALLRLPRGARVLSPRYWGGYVAWRAPGVLVFFDGRNREFPSLVHLAGGDMLSGRANVGALLHASRTQWVLTTPDWGALQNVRAAGWRPIYAAPGCALFASASSPPLTH